MNEKIIEDEWFKLSSRFTDDEWFRLRLRLLWKWEDW